MRVQPSGRYPADLVLTVGFNNPEASWITIDAVRDLYVTDDGEVSGIEPDLPFVKKHDVDGWELWLTDAVANALGKGAAAELDVKIAALNGNHVARIDVGPSAAPVFGAPPNGGGKPAFLVRINNTTQERRPRGARVPKEALAELVARSACG